MTVEVDIARLRNHIELVEVEKRECRVLIDMLTQLHQQATVTGIPDIELINKHLGIARKQAENIRQRASLLEESIECFSRVRDQVADDLDEAKRLIVINS